MDGRLHHLNLELPRDCWRVPALISLKGSIKRRAVKQPLHSILFDHVLRQIGTQKLRTAINFAEQFITLRSLRIRALTIRVQVIDAKPAYIRIAKWGELSIFL